MEIDIVKAILAINPDAEVIVKGDDIDKCDIQWVNKTKEISKSDIKAKMTAIAYIGKRQAEYPSFEDQLDDLYHNGLDGWKKTIKAIKDKYPKE
jgi:hypothetical protein